MMYILEEFARYILNFIVDGTKVCTDTIRNEADKNTLLAYLQNLNPKFQMRLCKGEPEQLNEYICQLVYDSRLKENNGTMNDPYIADCKTQGLHMLLALVIYAIRLERKSNN